MIFFFAIMKPLVTSKQFQSSDGIENQTPVLLKQPMLGEVVDSSGQ